MNYLDEGKKWMSNTQCSVLQLAAEHFISAIRISHGFFRLGRWPERTWQARTSQITRVEIKLVISAAS